MGLTCPPGQFLSVTSSGAWSLGSCEVTGEVCSCEVLPPLPYGDIGLHSAIAHDDRGAIVSAYDLTYGDLMFGIVQSSGSIDWEFVDGVPSSTTSITGDLAGPRAGNSDLGDDVGKYSDLAVDASNRPHVSYHDATNGALKYALGTASGWNLVTVDARSTSGLYSSLTIAAGRPRIAYLTAREHSATGPRRSTLRIAIAVSDSPATPGDFVIRDVDSIDVSALGCADACDPNEVCRAFDEACMVPNPAACRQCGPGERCLDSACTPIEALPPYRDIPNARGLFPSIAAFADGTTLIAYQDRIEGNLKVARIAGPDPSRGAITLTVIDGPGSGTTDLVGGFSSLFVTPGGELYLAYENATRRSVVYRQLSSTDLSTIVVEEIESGLSAQPDAHFLGADVSLVVDADGTARVAFQDATLGELRFAQRRGPSDWTVTTLRGNEDPYAGSFGFYNDQTLTPDRRRSLLSTYRYFLSASGGPDNGLEVISLP